MYNNFNGIGKNNPTYYSQGYSGPGASLALNKVSSQSVTIVNPPFLNTSYHSFTVQVWIFANSLCDGTTCLQNVIFGQLEQETKDKALHCTIRNKRIYLGFYNDDVSGNFVS